MKVLNKKQAIVVTAVVTGLIAAVGGYFTIKKNVKKVSEAVDEKEEN